MRVESSRYNTCENTFATNCRPIFSENINPTGFVGKIVRYVRMRRNNEPTSFGKCGLPREISVKAAVDSLHSIYTTSAIEKAVNTIRSVFFGLSERKQEEERKKKELEEKKKKELEDKKKEEERKAAYLKSISVPYGSDLSKNKSLFKPILCEISHDISEEDSVKKLSLYSTRMLKFKKMREIPSPKFPYTSTFLAYSTVDRAFLIGDKRSLRYYEFNEWSGTVSDLVSKLKSLMTNKQLLMLCGDIEMNPGPRRGRRRGKNFRKPAGRKPAQRANRSFGGMGTMIMPSRFRANFCYSDSSYVRNNPGNNFLVYSFRVNDLNDPDPLILSGSVSGFKEIMQFYSYYRVMHITIKANISNNESFDLMYGGVFSQTNLTGVVASRDDAINALENRLGKGPFLLSEKGGMDRGRFSMSVPIWAILGDKRQYMADTNYSGSGLATPAIPLWFNFIVCSPTGAALTNGYTTTTKLFFHSEFFGTINLRA